jgi:hypothetical protein
MKGKTGYQVIWCSFVSVKVRFQLSYSIGIQGKWSAEMFFRKNQADTTT